MTHSNESTTMVMKSLTTKSLVTAKLKELVA
jgi:hypothetical protein